jgi:hypothetical protein
VVGLATYGYNSESLSCCCCCIMLEMAHLHVLWSRSRVINSSRLSAIPFVFRAASCTLPYTSMNLTLLALVRVCSDYLLSILICLPQSCACWASSVHTSHLPAVSGRLFLSNLIAVCQLASSTTAAACFVVHCASMRHLCKVCVPIVVAVLSCSALCTQLSQLLRLILIIALLLLLCCRFLHGDCYCLCGVHRLSTG